MSPLSQELKMLIDQLSLQVNRVQDMQTHLQERVDELAELQHKSLLQYITEERLKGVTDAMKDDIQDIKESLKSIKDKDLKDLREAIIGNQQAGLRRTVRIQAGILSGIGGTLITLVLNNIYHFLPFLPH